MLNGDTWQDAPTWLMGDPGKLAATAIVLLAVGLCALAVERLTGWLRIAAIALVLVVMGLLLHPAWAHDHKRPGLNDWLSGLHARNKAWCCNGEDYDAIEDWETKGDRYRVKFRGQWYDVPEGAVIDGPNNAGDAILWMNKGYLGNSVRCFMPGSLT